MQQLERAVIPAGKDQCRKNMHSTDHLSAAFEDVFHIQLHQGA